jgi:deoxycytidine triphosphate deaminase
VSVLTDKEIRTVLNRDLVIFPFSEDCLSPLGYDLRIGYAINLNTQGATSSAPGSEVLVIPPKTSTFVISKEHVWLSEKLMGTLHARGSLAAKGLFLNSTTVDPNWRGQMTFLLYNASEHPVELDVESTFTTMVLYRVGFPTENGPPTDPLHVAETYGGLYGDLFSRSLISYITGRENLRDERDFNALVEGARTPTAGKLISQAAATRWKQVRVNKNTYFQNTMIAVSWTLALAAVGVGFTLQWLWPILQKLFGFQDTYGPSILMSQIALIVAALAVFSRLLKRG